MPERIIRIPTTGRQATPNRPVEYLAPHSATTPDGQLLITIHWERLAHVIANAMPYRRSRSTRLYGLVEFSREIRS